MIIQENWQRSRVGHFRNKLKRLGSIDYGGVGGLTVKSGLLSGEEASFGLNAETEKYEDLVAAGVIDPTKVTRTALGNAASIAALLLTTEVLVGKANRRLGFSCVTIWRFAANRSDQ